MWTEYVFECRIRDFLYEITLITKENPKIENARIFKFEYFIGKKVFHLMLYNVNFCQLIDNRFLICFRALYDSQFMWTFTLHMISLLVILAENRVKLNVAP